MKIRQIIRDVASSIDNNQVFKNVTITGTIKSVKQYNFGCYIVISDGDDTNDNIDAFINYRYVTSDIGVGYCLECIGNIRLAMKYKKIEYNIKTYTVIGTDTKIKYDFVLEKLVTDQIISIPCKPIHSKYKHIGVISSLNAAGLKDCLSILLQNMIGGDIIIYESSVQGEKTASDVMHCIDIANSENHCDVLMIIRGGGAKTDLEDFNDYDLAVKIKNSKIPVVCGIGHEIDRTIVDDVVDHSFITPTDAAESISCGNCGLVHEIDSMITKYNDLLQSIFHKHDGYVNILNDFSRYAGQVYDITIRNNISKYNNILDMICSKVNNSVNMLNQYPEIIDKYYGSEVSALYEQISEIYQQTTKNVMEYDKKLANTVRPKIIIDDKVITSKQEFMEIINKQFVIKFLDGDISCNFIQNII
jgi:exodeoxyribonuclease VII large subunit